MTDHNQNTIFIEGDVELSEPLSSAPIAVDEVLPQAIEEISEPIIFDEVIEQPPVAVEQEVIVQPDTNLEGGHLGDAQELIAEVGYVDTADAHSGGGLPQLNPASYSSQLFWLAICFVTIYLMVSRIILPRIHEVLEKRKHRIEYDIDIADEMSKKAKQARQNYEELHKSAIVKNAKIIADVEKKINDMIISETSNIDVEIAEKISLAKADIVKKRADVKSKLIPVASDLASEIVKLFSGKSVNKKELGLAIKFDN